MSTTLFIVLLILAVGVLLTIAFMRHDMRDANGRVRSSTALEPTQVLDSLSRHFVRRNWSVEHRDAEFVALSTGPNPVTGCILSILFLPLGLVYLLTDMGRGRLNARASPVSALQTTVEIEWQGAGVRKQIEAFARWLERDGQD